MTTITKKSLHVLIIRALRLVLRSLAVSSKAFCEGWSKVGSFSLIGPALIAIMAINGMEKPNQIICSDLQDIKIEGELHSPGGWFYLSTKKRNKVNQKNKKIGLPQIFPHDACTTIAGSITNYNDADKAINFMIKNGGTNKVAKRITKETKNSVEIKQELKKFLNVKHCLHFGFIMPVASLIYKKNIKAIRTNNLNLILTSYDSRKTFIQELLEGENYFKQFPTNICCNKNENLYDALDDLVEQKILKNNNPHRDRYYRDHEHGEWGWPMHNVNTDLMGQSIRDAKPANPVKSLMYRQMHGSFPKK